MPTQYLLVGTFNTNRIFTFAFSSKPSEETLELVKINEGQAPHSWLALNVRPIRTPFFRLSIPVKNRLYATSWTTPPGLACYTVSPVTPLSSPAVTFLNAVQTAARSGYVCVSPTHVYSAGGPAGEVFALDTATGAFKDGEDGLLQKLDFVGDERQQDSGGTISYPPTCEVVRSSPVIEMLRQSLRARMDHLHRRFTEPPTAEEKRVVNERRAKAEAIPLQRGTLVDFYPLQDFCQSRPSKQPQSDIPSPVPQRPLDLELFHALDPSSSTGNIRLRLDFHIVTEGDNWSQVWTAEVERDGQQVGKVAAKLLVEALLPHAPMQVGPRTAHPLDRSVSDVLVRAETQA
ncbi:hypothetical protein JCM11641_004395 [Rhodosporidiobolus odoratus]